MLKFHQIVLRKFLTLFIALFIIVGGIVYYWVYEFYLNASKETLKQNIELIAMQIQNNPSDLDLLAKEIKDTLNLRLTIINNDGDILAESHKDKSKMENHKYRDEVMQANDNAFGYKTRYSKTLHKDLLYVVKKYTIHNKTVYIRLSREINGIQNEIFVLGLKILGALILFFIAIFIVTYKINLQVQNEVGKIVTFLKSLTKKKKTTYINSEYSQEFALITNLLTKVSYILVKKEKQKSKYTERLKESNKQKDDIISAISHEFKNPIAVVNGYAQTLLEDDNLNINIRKKFLSKIHNNGEKLNNLIDTLRLSMKLDGKQQSLSTKRTNLYTLLQETSENLKLSYPRREVIIQGKSDIFIDIDETLFGIVITNLIENAFKYSEDEVYVILSEHSVTVKDTGIGISKKDLEKITQKFYRVHTNSWNNSLGLGLFLVNKIVSLHNFKLTISSEVNKGSSFTIEW